MHSVVRSDTFLSLFAGASLYRIRWPQRSPTLDLKASSPSNHLLEGLGALRSRLLTRLCHPTVSVGKPLQASARPGRRPHTSTCDLQVGMVYILYVYMPPPMLIWHRRCRNIADSSCALGAQRLKKACRGGRQRPKSMGSICILLLWQVPFGPFSMENKDFGHFGAPARYDPLSCQ